MKELSLLPKAVFFMLSVLFLPITASGSGSDIEQDTVSPPQLVPFNSLPYEQLEEMSIKAIFRSLVTESRKYDCAATATTYILKRLAFLHTAASPQTDDQENHFPYQIWSDRMTHITNSLLKKKGGQMPPSNPSAKPDDFAAPYALTEHQNQRRARALAQEFSIEIQELLGIKHWQFLQVIQSAHKPKHQWKVVYLSPEKS